MHDQDQESRKTVELSDLTPPVPMPELVSPAPPKAVRRRGLIGPLCFTGAFLGLIAISIEGIGGYLAVALLGSVVVLVTTFHYAFPGSRFFTFAFTNLIGIYACVFGFFLESNFGDVGPIVTTIGFVAPLAAFLGAVVWRRRTIQSVVFSTKLRHERHFGHSLIWLVPVFAIGGLTFAIPGRELNPAATDWIFLVAMLSISAVVSIASRDVTVFLLDTGLLFEEFFDRAARLVVPAFAFLTFYSLVVIIFASVYSVLDRLSSVRNFRVNGALKSINFAESIYFSVTTLSTVGYGDIVAVTGPARILVGSEIVCGVLLLLFGVNEIVTYSRDRRAASQNRGRRS